MRSRLTNLLKFHRLSAVGVAAFLILIAAAPAHASVVSDMWNNVQDGVLSFFGNILLTVLQALAQLLAQVIHILVILAQYNNFINNDVVKTGWNLVMDVTNMFFIIALLVIAFGTVLRLQNYRYNRLLGNVIVMAFLTNFSKLIAGFFIQTSQVFMLTFVNGFRDAAFGNFATMFGLDKVLTFASGPQAPNGLGDLVATLIIGLLFIVVALIVMVALTMVIAVRIVMLWILVILSPAAFALRVLPNTDNYASEWWKKFGQWTVNGPIIAFFIWLALAIMSQSAPGGNGQAGTWMTSQPSVSQAIAHYDNSELNLFFKGSLLLDINNFISFIIGIVFLLLALQYAQSMGGAAGKWAGKVATAGFGAYGTISGLNWLRDRTVAPVQGYLAQRDQRRKQGIQERAAAISHRVDQATSVASFVPGRAAAFLQAGAKATVRTRSFNKALSAAAAAAQTGTRADRQRAQRADEYRAQKAKTDLEETDYSQMSEAQLRGLSVAGSAAQRYNAITKLMTNGQLDPVTDKALFDEARNYAGSRTMGQKFVQAAAKSSPELARGAFGDITIHDDLQRILEAIQNGTIGTEVLSDADKAFLTANSVAGAQFTEKILVNARNQEEAAKRYKGLGDAGDGISRHMDLTGQNYDTRARMANVTGHNDLAFSDRDATTGAMVVNAADARKYVKSRGNKISDQVSADAVGNRDYLAAVREELSEKELKAIAEKSDDHRSQLTTGLEAAVGDIEAATGGRTWNIGDANYATQEKFRRALFAVSGGSKSAYQMGDVNSMESFKRLAKSLKAGEVAKLHLNPQYAPNADLFHEILGMKMTTHELGELAARGGRAYELARKSAKRAYEVGVGTHTSLAGINPTAADKRKQSLEKSESTADLL